jgi:hypothetical protein
MYLPIRQPDDPVALRRLALDARRRLGLVQRMPPANPRRASRALPEVKVILFFYLTDELYLYLE